MAVAQPSVLPATITLNAEPTATLEAHSAKAILFTKTISLTPAITRAQARVIVLTQAFLS